MSKQQSAPETWADARRKGTIPPPAASCPRCNQHVHGGLPDLVDLHQLIAREGLEAVAEVLSEGGKQVTPGGVKNMRSAYRPIRLAQLCQLKVAYVDFDIDATVLRLGPRRVERTRGKAEQQQGGEGKSKGPR